MKYILAACVLLLLQVPFLQVPAQTSRGIKPPEKCGTMDRLAQKFARNPLLKARFATQLNSFNKAMEAKAAVKTQANKVADAAVATTYTIPIVFHIVLKNPAVVTDAQIASQLNVLNKDFAGTNADSTVIPAYFKPLFGKGNIQFCLAQRTPNGEITNGIDRVATTENSFSNDDDGVKHAASGGVDIWDGDKYFNIWVCELSGGLLGYGSFPDDGSPAEQGIAIHYQSLPGGSLARYNGGKTLTHETGHYFNLFHIWGDDNGECSGSDFVSDTPNQADSSNGCYSGIHRDQCTSTGNGILYQDYMDYSDDPCLVLFTPLQQDRMLNTLLTYRLSLTTSNGCTPVVLNALDAQLKAIASPGQRICSNTFTPVVTIKNRGSQTLASVVISASIDGGAAVSKTFTGPIASLDTSSFALSPLTVGQGIHAVKIFVSSPNAGVDGDKTNDTLTTTVQYYAPVQTVSESFEGTAFPPAGWDIVNPDGSITWQKVTGIAKTGNASVLMNNFDYAVNGEKDYLRLPEASLVNADSAFLSFEVAATTFTQLDTVGNNYDTLEVLLSKDCGLTYTSLYKKWGASLVTTTTENTDYFIPAANEWRKDSVNLTPYMNGGSILLAFRNTSEYENNIYLDDINIRTQNINPNLKSVGFLLAPNPASSNVSVQFYPNPAGLKGIGLYNLMGQKLSEITVGPASVATVYNFNVGRYPAGVYVVRAVFADKVLVKKVVKE